MQDSAAGGGGSYVSGSSQGGGGSVGGGPAPPTFVSWEEKREVAERKPPRKSSGHTYTVKFFLVDIHGTEYLAATGEDQGDAHYLYENQSAYPFLRANNKADVRTWLEGIVTRSKERAGVHSHLVTDAVPRDPRMIHLPKFVGHSHEKQELADGRHRIEWFLLDEQNAAHLAIVGEEKETRDGHYLYRTYGVFDKHLPLQVGNQREVERWIDIMVFHGGVAPALAAGKAPADSTCGATSGRAHSDTSGPRGGGSSRGGHGGGHQRAAQKHDLLRQATSNVKKLKAWRPDPDQEARDVVGAELARWAQDEAQRREAAKKQAFSYVMDPLAGKEATAARRCLAVLQQAAASPSFLPPPPGARGGGSSAGTHQQQLNLVDTLAALRELGHMYVPLSLVALPELKECLAQLQTHEHLETRQLAGQVLRQWLLTAVAQAQVLADPRYVQDPRSVLEASLANRSAMDDIVSAVTHRKLHPRPQQQQHYNRTAAQGRAGSRLGAHTPAGAGTGAAGGQYSQPAATPGHTLVQPSGSLPDLTGLAGPADSAGGGNGTASAAAAAAGGAWAAAPPVGTVERRRLNLGALEAEEDGDTLGGGGSSELGGGGVSYGGVGGDEEPSTARVDGPGLPYVASVDLIQLPIEDMESEQAELL